MRRGRALDEAFAARVAGLDGRDRAFARNLSATALRRLGQIDAVLAAYLAGGLPQNAAAVTDILRVGAAELLFLDKAPHAAVNEAVDLADRLRLVRFKGLVNAVLRRIAREGSTAIADQDPPRLNTPAWLWQSWHAAYGAATARSIAQAHLAEAPLDLSVRAEPELWSRRLEGTLLPTGTVRLMRPGPVAELPGYGEGAWWVQDAAAALPAKLFGDVRGQSVIDLCAAPGGKAAQLAAAGARVTAVEKSAARAQRLQDSLARLGLEAEIVIVDAAAFGPGERAGAVLLDAPCTATGTIRRHPDLPWRKRAADVSALAVIQDRLLDAAASMLKPGGILVYCVCSLQPEEGEQRVARFLRRQTEFSRRSVGAAEIGGLGELVTAEGDVRTLPCDLSASGGLDGFFIARLVRRP